MSTNSKTTKTNNSIVRTRFAPSPTGYLHIGGLRTACYAYLFAKKHGGKFILRIEDTDLERKVAGAEEVIYNTLKQAGLHYDEGPDVGGEYGPYIQSERKASYGQYAQQLVKNGGAYPCFCSVERLEKMREGGATKYDKHCLKLSKDEVAKRLANGEPHVIRQNIPQTGTTEYADLVFGTITIDNDELEDGVLIKSDGMPTYNFANVIDDYLMGINYVMRGTEYLSSTPKYNHIYDGLGLEKPQYIHMQPIMRDSKHKLSKRDGDASFDDFVKSGYLPDAILNYIILLGWSPKSNDEKFTLKQAEEMFTVEGLSKSPSIFDLEKLKWLNAQYIKELSEEEFYKLATPFLNSLEHIKDLDKKYLCTLLQSRCSIIRDVVELCDFIKAFDNFDLNLFISEKWKTDITVAKAMLPPLLKELTAKVDMEELSNLSEIIEGFAIANGYKKGQVLLVFRLALTGSLVTPGGAHEMAKLLGTEVMLSRLATVIQRL
ncbi:MAG: glutamate--tRNA ligase [Firmicutes bacterium]|nr:glutamate--tRNA ligase [Bacillota bacterium]